jgi:hypothetical protein
MSLNIKNPKAHALAQRLAMGRAEWTSRVL